MIATRLPVECGLSSRCLAVLLCAMCVPCCLAQTKAAAEPAKNGSPAAQVPVPSAADRQKAMQADTDRLLQLARQLKAEVDHSRQDELSIKVIRDADEIDKLARSARGRIR